jgi:hypothetical protein
VLMIKFLQLWILVQQGDNRLFFSMLHTAHTYFIFLASSGPQFNLR